MHLIKGILLILSLFQFIIQDTFWQNNFYWLFLWVIAFQLLWFYLENPRYKKIMLGILTLLAIINVVILPDLPIMMLGVYMIDLREQFTRRHTALVLGMLTLILIGIWTFLSEWPAINSIFILMAVFILCAWSTEQSLDIKRQNEARYEYLFTQNEMKTKADLLKAQMQSMEEVYKLNERNRISRDLHDSVGHTLSTIIIQLAAIRKLTEKSTPEASKMLDELHHFTKRGLANVREVIHKLKPSKHSQIAFVERLNHLIKEFEAKSQIQSYLNTNEMQWTLNEEQEELIYRAVQEFLGNTIKHSQATEVRIQYHFTDSLVILTMRDNGKGTKKIEPQMGLTGMKERAKLLGGKINIQSATSSGFKVRIVLPKGGYMDVTNSY